MNKILEARNIIHRVKNREIVDIENLQINQGEIVSIIGENGAGKTTLMLILASLIKPSMGVISYRNMEIGKNITDKDYRKKIAILFQENLFLETTVFENVAIGLKFRKLSREVLEDKVKNTLKLLKIFELRDRKAKNLSGGEAKRVCIARALIIEPEILFLDEPFTNIDSASKEEILTDMGKIIKEKQITTIMVTHDKYEALRLSERIIVMENGKIIQNGPKDEVIHHPKNNFVASFAGVENILEGRVLEKKDGENIIDVQGKLINVMGSFEVGSKVYLFIRPENVFITRDSNKTKTSVRNHFKGKVSEITNMGFFYRITVNCKFNLISYITKTSFNELSLKIGDEVIAGFKATSVHIIEKI